MGGGVLRRSTFQKYVIYYDLQRKSKTLLAGGICFVFLEVNLKRWEFQKCLGHYSQVA